MIVMQTILPVTLSMYKVIIVKKCMTVFNHNDEDGNLTTRGKKEYANTVLKTKYSLPFPLINMYGSIL